MAGTCHSEHARALRPEPAARVHMHRRMHMHMQHAHATCNMHMHMRVTHATHTCKDLDLEWLEAKIAGKC